MGTSIEVGNPAALSFIVWVMWFYFFLRYYQYWSSEKDANILRDLYEMLQVQAFKYCNDKYKFSNNYGWDGSLSLVRERLFKWKMEKKDFEVGRGTFISDSFSVPIVLLMWWSIKAFLGYCFHKKHMSEHVLPFILAICAPLIKIHSMI